MRSAAEPWLVALAVFAVFIAVVAVTTPWQPFGDLRPDLVLPDASRDFSAAQLAAAADYNSAIRPPGLINVGLGVAVAAVLGFTSLGAAVVTAAARPFGGGWFWQVVLGGLTLLLIVRLATMPLSAWSESVRRTYGLSTRDWGGWLLDLGRGFAIQAIATLAALLMLIALARALPRIWWLVGAGAAAVLVVLASFVFPLVVEPVFNTFTPMVDGELRTSLMEMADEAGVDVDQVLVADASRRTTTLNAYVSGFGATQRIVVYDNLLEQAPAAEVRSIVAHELGHRLENDVRNGTLLGALAAAGAVCVLGGLLTRPWLLGRAGASGPGDAKVIALVLALAAIASLAATPAENLISRQVEARADVHALDLTQDPETFVQMQRTTALAAYSDPEPPTWLHGFFGSHPTKAQRMALARAWANLNGVAPPADLADQDREATS